MTSIESVAKTLFAVVALSLTYVMAFMTPSTAHGSMKAPTSESRTAVSGPSHLK